MKIIHYSYRKRGKIEFWFYQWPNSPVVFTPIKEYYFIRVVKWSDLDPLVTRGDLGKMELIVNQYLGREQYYLQRKYFDKERFGLPK
ncbi:hypothetical protein [Metabacillus idriensis]|uniref:hypothetical protein n=1 Tax=Metabacillus idriensis TaxID=324768 RepID=UPI00174A6E22|nr:hypothetical protein [Metabacillus idriensis]